LSADDICTGECQDEDGEDLVGLKWAGVRVPFSKMGQLNLKNTKIKEKKDVALTFVEDPLHDCWNLFQVFCFCLGHCHPQAKKFYARVVKPCGEKAQRLSRIFGKDSWFAESGHGRTNWNMGHAKLRNLCTEIAKLSGVDDFGKCAGHALRALCVAHCVGAGLSAADVAAKVRHSANQQQQDARRRVQQAQGQPNGMHESKPKVGVQVGIETSSGGSNCRRSFQASQSRQDATYASRESSAFRRSCCRKSCHQSIINCCFVCINAC